MCSTTRLRRSDSLRVASAARVHGVKCNEFKNSEISEVFALVEVALHAHCMKDRPGYKSGVRPNHWMAGSRSTFIGQLEFADREWLKPGETCVANGHFLIPTEDIKQFVPGYCWHICEAMKIVGYGKVIEIKHT